MSERNKIELDAVEKLQRKLAAMPDYRPRLVTKTEAVRLLLPEIHSMQRRGYSLSAIAGFLSDDGVVVSVMTLKAYMQQAGEKKRRPKPIKAKPTGAGPAEGREVSKKPEPPTDASKPESKAVASPAARTSEASGAEGTKKRTLEGLTGSAVRPDHERPKESAPPVLRRSAFVVREDTEDL
jgi:hypothetical protein